ncbi:adenylate/guanylate cyclase domain-containing protein [Aggregicoccus sp. 17bor-14]|uniref:CHASE2 domain-containing protein n=1 Tax=Myxococcaceae TaxID=31 RepID=UPI00129CCB64|nr:MULTISPECIES: adenylate/guanylate cyclase domain-containing protein [Myxococcaceae]MBF5041391.1 adenylate/guanylate cyclase domain-containing protein [Simulacricoccus sp. 17bor-14]MRI87175.1 adenylate/guanylate cyclase domain-containing protein [Aggregicoccus sp. 17bor-14]
MSLLSRRRFEVLALALAAVLCTLHWLADTTPTNPGAEGAARAAGVGETLVRGAQILEGRATDLKFRLRGPRAPHPDVVVVAVDEKSAQAYGLWPWPRERMAQAVDRLREAGVRAVGLDAIFTDAAGDGRMHAYADALLAFDRASPQRPPPGSSLEAFRALLAEQSLKNPDEQLAQALSRAPFVVQGVIAYDEAGREAFTERAAEQRALLEPHLLRRFPGSVPGSQLEVDFRQVPGWRMYSAQMALPVIARASPRVGYFNTAPDPDGTLRRVPTLAKLEAHGGFLAALEVQTAAAYLDASVEPVFDPELGKLTGVRLRRASGAPYFVPLQTSEPYTLINHLGPSSAFRTYSLSDVLDGKVGKRELAGKAVLFGVTLVGDYDQRVTPFKEMEAGVYVHASFLSNILSQDFLTRPASLRGLELLFMLLSALALGVLLPRVSYAWKLGAVALLGAGWLALDQLLFERGLQVATVLPLVNLLSVAFGTIFLGYLSVDREKGVLRQTFKHYLDASVMEQMLAHPEKLKLGGEKKELTVLFSDIRGFTTLSERMTPEGLVKFVNAYLTPMTDIVFEQGGTLDKYIGDAIMAFWGAPVDQPDHALRACRAALRFLEKLEELKAQWRAQGLPEFDIGVGINSGPMNVGNMGTHGRFNYTVMGDAVNLASRLEGTNKEYETRVLISEATWQRVREQVVARRLGAVRVKGKRRPVRIYELRALGQAQGADAEALGAFEAGVDHFEAQAFDEAQGAFERVLQLWPEDAPSRRYLAELEALKAQPPGPGWDGVYTATRK